MSHLGIKTVMYGSVEIVTLNCPSLIRTLENIAKTWTPSPVYAEQLCQVAQLATITRALTYTPALGMKALTTDLGPRLGKDYLWSLTKTTAIIPRRDPLIPASWEWHGEITGSERPSHVLQISWEYTASISLEQVDLSHLSPTLGIIHSDEIGLVKDALRSSIYTGHLSSSPVLGPDINNFPVIDIDPLVAVCGRTIHGSWGMDLGPLPARW